MLVRYAYALSEPQIAGNVKWLDETRFDILAKAEQPYPTDDRELLKMLQPLLAERFQLKMHREGRNLAGYALTVPKGGILAPVSAPTTRFSGSSTRNATTVAGCTMATLAIRLYAVLKQPVVDLTNDSRSFDFSLRWRLGELRDNVDSDAPSLFTALLEQVGVRLVQKSSGGSTGDRPRRGAVCELTHPT